MKNQIIRYCMLIALFSFILCSLNGAWIENMAIELYQPDGTRLHVFQSGDEFHNWIHDENGFTIIYDQISQYWCWAISENGDLASTGYPVHRFTPQRIGLTPFENISEENYLALRTTWDEDFGVLATNGLCSGTINNIVIFIKFKENDDCDTECQKDDDGNLICECAEVATDFPRPFSFYQDLFNDSGANANSLYQYYWEVSYENLEIFSTFYPINNGTLVLSYPAPLPKKNYNTFYARRMLVDALNYVKSDIPTHLNFDLNNDGNVDNITFIIRGGAGVWSSVFWSHKGNLVNDPYTNEPVDINGKKARVYNLISESHLDNGGGRIRVLAHEFGHTLGMPDLYSYNNNHLSPMWHWDMMSSGGLYPASFSTYTKWRYTSWVDDIPLIDTDGVYSLYPVLIHPDETTQKNRAYRINSPYTNKEYFIVEYRNKDISWIDTSFAGSGLVVYRVNTEKDGDGNAYGPPWEIYSYRPRDPDDNSEILYLGHFPALSNERPYIERYSITDFTNPSSFLSDGSPGGLNISNIQYPDTTISFTVTMVVLSDEVFVRPGYSHLPDHYETIKEAMHECADGGTVYIYPGTYVGEGNVNINWPSGRNITVTSKYIDNQAIIDCDGTRGFRFAENNNLNKISNIKIINGMPAIYITNTSNPIIDGVSFIGANYGLSGNNIGLFISNPEFFNEEVLILNSSFSGFANRGKGIDAGPTMNLTIKNCVFEDNIGSSGSALHFSGNKLHLEGNLFQNNRGTTNGACLNISVRTSYATTINIVNNRFVNNEFIGNSGNASSSSNITINNIHFADEVTITDNIFFQNASNQNDFPSVIINSNASSNTLLTYINNTEIGFGYSSIDALILNVGTTPVHIKNSIFTGKIHSTNTSNKTISNSWFFDIENPDTEVNLNTMITGILPNNRHDLFTGNPHLDMEILRPIWNSQFKSGLINNGHRDTNGDGIFWWNDPEDSDPDNTRLDIGAVHYQHGIIKHWIFPPFLSHQEQDYIIQPR
ncbi:MAG: M6 family metalloprotease domain-containing protein, partial [Candidatus Cloacimonetes bacterium]|nr:M6 family metalloprotease domain-containing protein [Candidatus Cloacimonadota bacterium]